MKSKYLLLALLSMASITSAFAAGDTDSTNNVCPPAYQAQIDQEFGLTADGTTTTSALTTCITKRSQIRNVLNLSTAVLNPKSGISQTLNNALLMVANYRDVYGINIGQDLKINIVAHFQGGQFLLSNDAYNRIKGVTTGNPSAAAVQQLIADGVHFYLCQNTMRGNGWKTADLAPGVEEVPGGVVALADFAQRGWAVITP